MKTIKIFFYLFVISLALIMNSCGKDDDTIPASQTIVTSDTSEYNGTLDVRVYYYSAGNVYSCGSGVDVYLYVSYQDIQNNLYIYKLTTNSSGSADFGYILFGNYYVRAAGTISSVTYEGINVVQVRSRRDEVLNLTMYQI